MATGTLQDLLNSGMSPEEINALLSQSTVGTTGFNPLGTMGGEPYVPPEPGYGPAGMVDVGTERNALTTGTPPNPLDSEESKKQHRQLMEWYYYERDRQSPNRLEMAVDHDFYDGQQWDPEDAAIVTDRKQMPLVFNEVAPMADWLIGTERRNRVDWKVLPRTEDDVDLADVKTKVLK